MTPGAGEQLRRQLLDLASSQGDHATAAQLAAELGLRAEKQGDMDTAVNFWRQSFAAGGTSGKAADRYSIWLVANKQRTEAACVIRQALHEPPQSARLRQALEKRLARCS
jgi:hypothetical protein